MTTTTTQVSGITRGIDQRLNKSAKPSRQLRDSHQQQRSATNKCLEELLGQNVRDVVPRMTIETLFEAFLIEIVTCQTQTKKTIIHCIAKRESHAFYKQVNLPIDANENADRL